jgi:hypothetical protein
VWAGTACCWEKKTQLIYGQHGHDGVSIFVLHTSYQEFERISLVNNTQVGSDFENASLSLKLLKIKKLKIIFKTKKIVHSKSLFPH